MTKKEIIEFLQPFPDDVKIYIAYNDGCVECNEEGMETLYPVTSIVFMPKGNYPNEDVKEFIQLE